MKLTAIYIRPTDENAETQAMNCSAWCDLNGIIKIERYTEYSVQSRKELDRLISEVRKGSIELVVCKKLNQIGRSLVHLARIVGELNAAGVALVCTSQGIDTRSDGLSGMTIALKAVVEFARSLIRDRTKEGLESAKVRGIQLGRPSGSRLNLPIEECLKAISAGISLRSFAKNRGISATSLRRAIGRERVTSNPDHRTETAP